MGADVIATTTVAAAAAPAAGGPGRPDVVETVQMMALGLPLANALGQPDSEQPSLSASSGSMPAHPPRGLSAFDQTDSPTSCPRQLANVASAACSCNWTARAARAGSVA
jgi:hypothetical protein